MSDVRQKLQPALGLTQGGGGLLRFRPF